MPVTKNNKLQTGYGNQFKRKTFFNKQLGG
jgi:hypothetical protein